LEELRLEIAALRQGLQATRGRVKTLEDEVRALKTRGPAPAGPMGGGDGGGMMGGGGGGMNRMMGGGGGGMMGQRGGGAANPDTGAKGLSPEAAAEPLAEAEAALKKLRADPSDKQAADSLERALKRLRDRAKPARDTGAPKGNSLGRD
jgi:hypothetical protein